MNSKLRHLLAFGALGLAAVSAETTPSPTPATPSAPPPACTAPEHRQFDFWLGSWIVRSPDGKKTAGTSQITRASGSCAILEQWKGAGDAPGTSINYYDAATKDWHQHWVGSDGTVLSLKGGLENGVMVMSSDTTPKNRITWTPLPEGKVEQKWATSEDGKEWKTIFVGIYSHE